MHTQGIIAFVAQFDGIFWWFNGGGWRRRHNRPHGERTATIDHKQIFGRGDTIFLKSLLAFKGAVCVFGLLIKNACDFAFIIAKLRQSILKQFDGFACVPFLKRDTRHRRYNVHILTVAIDVFDRVKIHLSLKLRIRNTVLLHTVSFLEQFERGFGVCTKTAISLAIQIAKLNECRLECNHC